MSNGIVANLDELIALRRYAKQVTYAPEAHALRTGAHSSKLRGRGMDFTEVRNYQAGDEIRHMEWRVTARTGRPHVKLFQEERERPAMLLVDFSPSMFFGTRIALKSVIATQVAALIAWTVAAQGDRVGGFMIGADKHQELPPRARSAGVLPLLALMCDYSRQAPSYTASARSLSQEFLRLRRVTRPGNTIILISDFYGFDQQCEQHLNRLSLHNDIVAYHICDPLELAPPKPQQYAITDGDQELLLDMTDKTVAREYQHYVGNRLATLKEQFKQLQIQYVQVTADMDLPLLIRQTYPRRIANA